MTSKEMSAAIIRAMKFESLSAGSLEKRRNSIDVLLRLAGTLVEDGGDFREVVEAYRAAGERLCADRLPVAEVREFGQVEQIFNP